MLISLTYRVWRQRPCEDDISLRLNLDSKNLPLGANLYIKLTFLTRTKTNPLSAIRRYRLKCQQVMSYEMQRYSGSLLMDDSVRSW